MTLAALLATTVAVEAISDQRLLTLAGETVTTEFGIVHGDTPPTRLAQEFEALLDDVREDRIDASVVEDDPDQSATSRLQALRQRLRETGRGLLAGTMSRPGRLGDETVLVLACPRAGMRIAEAVCMLDAV